MNDNVVKSNGRWVWSKRINRTKLPFRVTGVNNILPLQYWTRWNNDKFLHFWDHKMFGRTIVNEDIFIQALEKIRDLHVILYKKKYYIAGKGFLATYPPTGFYYSNESGWGTIPFKILYLANYNKSDAENLYTNKALNYVTEFVDKRILIDDEYKDIKKIIDKIVYTSVLPVTYTTDLVSMIEEKMYIPNFVSIADRNSKFKILLNNFVEDVLKTA